MGGNDMLVDKSWKQIFEFNGSLSWSIGMALSTRDMQGFSPAADLSSTRRDMVLAHQCLSVQEEHFSGEKKQFTRGFTSSLSLHPHLTSTSTSSPIHKQNNQKQKHFYPSQV